MGAVEEISQLIQKGTSRGAITSKSLSVLEQVFKATMVQSPHSISLREPKTYANIDSLCVFSFIQAPLNFAHCFVLFLHLHADFRAAITAQPLESVAIQKFHVEARESS